MKNFIKTVFAACLLLAGVNLQAVTPETIAKLDTEREALEKLRAQETIPTIVITPPNEGKLPTSLEQFTQLPRDAQVQILASINESNNPEEALKRLAQLRRVSKQVKEYIESPYTGKYLIQKIADRFIKKDSQDERERNVTLLNMIYSLSNFNTPGFLAWAKEQFTTNDTLRYMENASYVLPIKFDEIIKLQGGANTTFLPNKTILQFAAELGDIAAINKILDAGADINFVTLPRFSENNFNIQPATALNMPGLTTETINILRSRGAKTAQELISEISPDFSTPEGLQRLKKQVTDGLISKNLFNFLVYEAIGNNKLNSQQIMQLVGDPNYIIIPEEKMTLLERATEAQDEKLVKDFIALGANVNYVSRYFDPMHAPNLVVYTALDIHDLTPNIEKLLRSRGGKTAAELDQGQ